MPPQLVLYQCHLRSALTLARECRAGMTRGEYGGDSDGASPESPPARG